MKYKRREYYLKNRERYIERAKKWNKKHPERNKESSVVYRFKKEFVEILGNKCFMCGNKREAFHHLTYNNLPSVRYYSTNKFIEEYVKYIKPICNSCHVRINAMRRALNNIKTIPNYQKA